MSQQFRLPSGDYTKSVNRYLREWNDLTGAIEKKLGVKVYAFDPDVGVSMPDGSYVCSLPLWLAKRIAWSVEVKP